MNLSEMKRCAVPLHVEIADLWRHQIMSGALQPGSKLPPLSVLTDQFGVARMTIRQAMDALEDEGLIERYAGRGTFVRQVDIPAKHTLNMKAQLSQLQAMVSQLEVAVVGNDAPSPCVLIGGREFRQMTRIHSQDSQPFCHVEIQLDKELYAKAPKRFEREIVVSVMKDLQVEVHSARQRVTISYADVQIAEALGLTVNAPVFRVFREFFCAQNNLLYAATLIYPGDRLELDIEFAV